MTDLINGDVLTTLAQVIMIDLVLAGDNAVVIGLAAAGLPDKQRKRAILIGIVIATVLRIVGATIATQLLQVLGLLLAGGILLLWVCWKMWRELHMTPADHQKDDALSVENAVGRGETAPGGCVERRSARPRGKSLSRTSRCLWTMCWRSPARHASILLSFVDCPDGSCRQSNSATTPETPLDRLCRACNYSLRCLRNDISRKPRIDRRNQTSSAIADYPDI
jgi:ABC-type nickel/cobalt efflux system permease component RcnA